MLIVIFLSYYGYVAIVVEGIPYRETGTTAEVDEPSEFCAVIRKKYVVVIKKTIL